MRYHTNNFTKLFMRVLNDSNEKPDLFHQLHGTEMILAAGFGFANNFYSLDINCETYQLFLIVIIYSAQVWFAQGSQRETNNSI